MSQLVIIDVQERFLKGQLTFDELISNIILNTSNYSNFIFIMDSHDGHNLDFPESFYQIDEANDDEDLVYSFDPTSYPHIFKEYGFFRNFMDEGVSDEDIIELGKWLIKKKINDGRDIYEDPIILKEFKFKFKNSILINYDFNNHIFYIPEDLITSLEQHLTSGCTLAGGGINECLKEISLLLQIIDIEHTIDYSLTY